MKKHNPITILNLIFNILVVALVMFSQMGLVVFNAAKVENIATLFKYFTNLSNYLIGLSALIGIFVDISCLKKRTKIPFWYTALDFISTSAITMTFVIVMVWLGPNVGYSELLSIETMQLFCHLIVPVLAIINFSFFNIDKKTPFAFTPFGISSVIIYGIVYLVLVFGTKTWTDHYLLGSNGMPWLNCILFVAISYAISLLLWLLNKLMNRLIYGIEISEKDIEDIDEDELDTFEEPHEDDQETNEEKIEKTSKEETKTTSKTPKPKKKAPVNKKYKDGARVYHISRHNLLGKWQVKLATSTKAIKTFDTQLEAIKYAKQLVKTQGGSIRIHSVAGKIRK